MIREAPGWPRSAREKASQRARRLCPRLSVLGALLVGAVLLGGCALPTFGGFRGATVQGKEEFKLWSWLVMAGLLVTAIVLALIVYAVLRYRRRDDTIPRQFHEHIPIEITYTVIPILIVAAIFVFTVITENEIDAVTTHPTEIVHVLAYRWGWKFSYNDSNGKVQNVSILTPADPPTLLPEAATSKHYPQLVLPANETVEIVLNSQDVIHGFYVPAFNFSRYAQPGVTNTFDFTPTQIGVFRGQCTQFCGLYHAEMLFSVRVESASDFQSWLRSQQLTQSATTSVVNPS